MATQYMAPSAYSAQPPSMGYGANGYPAGKNGGFSFRKRVERVDWRKIASVDVDNIARTLDFSTLQENIMNITFCSLEAELDIRSIDPNFVKLFKLAQLTIEYLLHSQEYLAGLCASLEEKSKQSDQEVEKMKKEIETLQKELTDVKKESHKRKKLLIAQQQLMFAGNESYNKCPFCAKAFLNNSYLQSHITRRHAAGINNNKDGSNSVSPDLGVGSEGSRNNMNAELSEIKERLLRQEAELQEEKRALLSLKKKDTRIYSTQINQNMSVPGGQEQDKEEGETGMSAALMKEMKELNAKYQSSQRALRDLEVRTGASHLGEMEDDIDNDKELLKEQRGEVAALKEQLQQQLDQMKDHMQTKLERQDKKWQKKVHQMTQQHVSEIKKLNNALESTSRSLDGSHSPSHMKQQQDVEQLLRQSREQEKILEAQEQQLEKEIMQSSEVKPIKSSKSGHTPRGSTPRGSTPRGTTPRGTPRGQGQAIKHSSMYPSDDDESQGFGTTSSLRTVGHDTVGGSTLGSLHASQFLEELRKNPTLAVMREELAALLQEQIEKRGIPPNQTGITDQVLENKLSMLRTQRQTHVQKYPNFMELRDLLNKKATEEAKKQLKMQMGSPRGQPPAARPRRRLDLSPHTPRQFPPSPSGPRTGPPHPQQHLTAQRGTPRTPTGRAPSPKQQPQPQPRAKTPLSTGSTTEWTSTQFDSDDESDDESEDQVSAGGKAFFPSPGARLIQSGPAKGPGAPNPSPRMQGPQPRLIQSRPMNSNTYVDIDEMKRGGSPQRGGGNVSGLTNRIENQLQNRNPNVKPVGGVDTAKGMAGKQVHEVGNLDELSDWDEPTEQAPVPVKRPAVRASTDGMSTNTYGTSAWGSSSKAASTVKDKERRSTSRSSFVSVTASDVSTDDEMNLDNI